jgi:3',5'-cyclic AMP phosphodiesterase CpdA
MSKRVSRRSFAKLMLGTGACTVVGGCYRNVWGVTGAPSGSLRIVFYTDVHARTEWETPLALARAAEAINAQEADLILGGGDLITDGFQNAAAKVARRWDVYMAFHSALNGEVHSAIGNHDLVGAIPEDGSPPSLDPRAEFRHRLGVSRTYYSFDMLGYHIVLLDSIQVTGDVSKYQGLVGPEQMAWLKEDLAGTAKGMPIILVLHMPLLTAFYQATERATAAAPPGRVVVNNVDVLDLLDNYNVVLVLQGHLHVAEMLKWRSTAFITGGAVCGRWWRGSWQGTPEGFSVITLHENRVDWDYITYDWEARRPPGV